MRYSTMMAAALLGLLALPGSVGQSSAFPAAPEAAAAARSTDMVVAVAQQQTVRRNVTVNRTVVNRTVINRNVTVNRNVNVRRAGFVGPGRVGPGRVGPVRGVGFVGPGRAWVVRPWVRRAYFGTIVGGVALGTIIAVSAYGVAPVPPDPDLCWYWADPAQIRGYWAYCGDQY